MKILKLNVIRWLIIPILLLFAVMSPAIAQNSQSTQPSETASQASPQHIIETIKEFLATKGTAFALDLLAAILIFIIGRWLAKWISIIIGKVMTKARIEQILVRFVQHLCYFGLLAFVIIAALDRLGIKLTAAIAVLGAAALAVAFALQGSLSNFAAGILMVIFKPFKV